MRFEVVNPSDHITMETNDLEVAAICCIAIGRGAYALREVDENDDSIEDGAKVPFFMFGGHDEWFNHLFGVGVADSMTRVKKERLQVLIEALNSFHCTGERSSLNDICSQAHEIAKALLEEQVEANP